MIRLGGSTMTMEGSNSSVQKGESLADMGQMVSCFADIVAMRHPKAYSVEAFSQNSRIPVINAGDGPNEHPTQALLDLYTIQKEKNQLDNLHIGFMGDLKYGRTIHSLVDLLQHTNNTLHLISHPELRLPHDIKEHCIKNGIKLTEHEDLETCIESLDILYATRIQEERFDDPNVFEACSKTYQITPESLKKARPSLRILHPLPKVNEIDPEVDKDPRAIYFKQAQNGLYVRMAILTHLLGN